MEKWDCRRIGGKTETDKKERVQMEKNCERRRGKKRMVDNELERKPEKDDVKARDMEFKRKR